MSNINLRAWREEKRQQQQKLFFAVLLGVALLTGLVIVITSISLNYAITSQKNENSFLQKEIASLDKQIQEINQMQEKRAHIVERMHVINELQSSRPIVVQVFDELVRTLPEGIFYQKISRENNKLMLSGASETNNQISELMRRLEHSVLFQSPSLTEVKATQDEQDKSAKKLKLPPGLNRFELSVTQLSTENIMQGE